MTYGVATAASALVVYGTWLATAVATGFRAHQRAVGHTSVDDVVPENRTGWAGGLVTAAGLGTAITAAVLSALAIAPAPSALQRPALQAVGFLVAVAGAANTVATQRAFGYRPELVTIGPFRWIRNPIYTAAIVTSAGLVLLVPTWLHLVGFALVVAGLEIKVRAVEEPYLLRTVGAPYVAYAARTGRFMPGIGRLSLPPGLRRRSR